MRAPPAIRTASYSDGAVPDRPADQPSKRTILEVPQDYYDLTPEEQDGILDQMAETIMREQPSDD